MYGTDIVMSSWCKCVWLGVCGIDVDNVCLECGWYGMGGGR